MIIVFLNWIFIFFTTFLIGFFGIIFLKKTYDLNEENINIHPTIISLLGLAIITSMGNYVSIIYRINWEFVLFLVLSSSILLYLYRKELYTYYSKLKNTKIHFLTLISSIVFVFIAMVKASESTEVADEAQYYLATIRWIETYPVIPGAALFLDRIAYNSTFHLSSAIFSHAYIFKGGLYDLNSYLFVIINLFFLGGVNKIITCKQASFSNYLMLFSCIVLYRRSLTSINADYSHIFIGIILLLLFLEKPTIKKLKIWDINSFVFTILVLFLVTIKFLAIYFIPFVLVLFYFQFRQKNYRRILITLGLGTLYILPWFVRNVYLGGYLVYPLYMLDFFSVDWKLPLEMAKNNYLYVNEHAKITVARHSLYYDNVRNISITEWLPIWKKNQVSHNLSAALTYYFMPFTLFSLVYLFIKRGKVLVRQNITEVIALVVALFFLVFWFFQYPDIRFGWGWVLFVFSITIYQTNKMLFKIPTFFMRLFCLILFFVTLCWATSKTVQETNIMLLTKHYLKPKEVTILNNYSRKKVGTIEVIVSENMDCWGAAPPCMTNYYNDFNIEMRGTNIRDGFRLKK